MHIQALRSKGADGHIYIRRERVRSVIELIAQNKVEIIDLQSRHKQTAR